MPIFRVTRHPTAIQTTKQSIRAKLFLHDGDVGLDFVERVMRTEEVFSVELPDEECQLILTVGDLYRLVVDKLELPYVPSSEIELHSVGMARSSKSMQLSAWTSPDVWLTVKGVVREELGIEPSSIRESAKFVDDLRCD
jgi:acyl carrier protein